MTSDLGEEKIYSLIEMNGQQRDEYLNCVKDNVSIGTDGSATIIKFDGLQSSLVSKCLHDENGVIIPSDVIQAYPSSVVDALFEAAQKLNGLNKDSETQAKNV